MPTRFLFVEGIIGSGKTTTCAFIGDELVRQGMASRVLSEGGDDHTLRIALELPHPNAVWRDTTPDDFIARSLDAWRRYAEQAASSVAVTVCDGLLFHGNLTDLLMMNADAATLHRYAGNILKTLASLQPAVIYLYPSGVARALRAICNARGAGWEAYQINWKTNSPYAVQRGLRGFDGLVRLYQDYRTLCDAIFAELPVPRLGLLNDGDWPAAYAHIRAWLAGILGLAPASLTSQPE